MPRQRPTFSLASLFGLTALAAVGSAALANHNQFWQAIVVSAALSVLVASVLCAIVSKPPVRRFWIGFAVVGWGYWVICSTDLLLDFPDEKPVSTRVLVYCWERLEDKHNLEGYRIIDEYYSNDSYYNYVGETTRVSLYQFLHIGHAVISLVVAYLAGAVTSVLCALRVRNEAGKSTGQARDPSDDTS